MNFFDSLDITRALYATALAIVSMTSMLMGTAFGLFTKPSQRLNAIIMAFGTGALIQALAIDLALKGAQRLTHDSLYSGLDAWMYVSGGFIAGGLIYYLVNKWLDKKGAAIRHPALAKFYYLKKKQEESKAILEQLSKVELVRSLPPEEMESVLSCVEPVTVKQDEIIFHQGDPGDALYLIHDGLIDIQSKTDGQAKVIATLGAGHSFGEMALLTGDPRSASAIAKTDATLLRLGKDQFDALMEVSPSLRKAVEQLNSQRILHNVHNLKEPMDAEHWKKIAASNISRLSKVEELNYMKKHASTGNPFAMFLGALMDTIPESIIIGAGFITLESYKFTFMLAVFLSNLPESMGSSSNMLEAGFSKTKIFTLWSLLIVAGAIAAAVGNMFLIESPPIILSMVEAVAGGGILAMVASVMMPEAYEDGGAEVGLATIAGFLAALFFTLT
jgi:zinc transporter ZupT